MARRQSRLAQASEPMISTATGYFQKPCAIRSSASSISRRSMQANSAAARTAKARSSARRNASRTKAATLATRKPSWVSSTNDHSPTALPSQWMSSQANAGGSAIIRPNRKVRPRWDRSSCRLSFMQHRCRAVAVVQREHRRPGGCRTTACAAGSRPGAHYPRCIRPREPYRWNTYATPAYVTHSWR